MDIIKKNKSHMIQLILSVFIYLFIGSTLYADDSGIPWETLTEKQQQIL
ncbi:MAG: hypothetical protein QUS12_05310 [Methanosarcina sp.]|nr:hypothetical protein [Methanosarcina sp.]